jgi:antitoxin component of MazEF toxin-antitoxin module
MKKIIKKWGDSFVIRFSPDEVKILRIKEDEIVNVEITKEKQK